MRLHAQVVQHRGHHQARDHVVPVADDSLDALAQHHRQRHLEPIVEPVVVRIDEVFHDGIFGGLRWLHLNDRARGCIRRLKLGGIVQVHAGEILREVTHGRRVRRRRHERFIDTDVVEVVRRTRTRRGRRAGRRCVRRRGGIVSLKRFGTTGSE